MLCLFYNSVIPATMNQLETRGMTRASGHDCLVITLRVAGELLHTKRSVASVVDCLF